MLKDNSSKQFDSDSVCEIFTSVSKNPLLKEPEKGQAKSQNDKHSNPEISIVVKGWKLNLEHHKQYL